MLKESEKRKKKVKLSETNTYFDSLIKRQFNTVFFLFVHYCFVTKAYTEKNMLDPDLDEYLTEYRLQAPTEPISHYEGKK